MAVARAAPLESADTGHQWIAPQGAQVAERIDKISVFGGLDQVLNGLVKLQK